MHGDDYEFADLDLPTSILNLQLRNYMPNRKTPTPIVPVPAVFGIPMLNAFPSKWEAFHVIVDSMPQLEDGLRGQNVSAACYNQDSLSGRSSGVVRIPREYFMGWTMTSAPGKYALYARLHPEWIRKSRQQAVRNAAKAQYQHLADSL